MMTKKNLRDKYPSAFPKLKPVHLKILAEISESVTYYDREVLIRSGETGFKCHVIKKGEVELIDVTGNEPMVLIVQGPNEFTGDLTNLAGRSSNVDIVARGKVEVYEISYEKLWNILSSKPELSDILLTAFTERTGAMRDLQLTGLRVIGPEYSADTFRITNYLTMNRIRFTKIDTGNDSNPKAKELLSIFNVKPEDLPVVVHGNSWMLYNPTNIEIAEKIGLKKRLKEIVFDLAIVGAGPAGLAAGVYGASEGLKTVILESIAAGGQAAASSKIENYLGFPMGISGADLAAGAALQAGKFGAYLNVSSRVSGLYFEDDLNIVEIESGEKIKARSILIASGAEYRKLELENLDMFEGRGVYYAATKVDAAVCDGKKVAVIGGGNSAGQAAVFLSATAKKIYIIIRGSSLSLTMSNYLVSRIEDADNIEVITDSEITKINGEDHLEIIEVQDNVTKLKSILNINTIFSFIGAIPNTKWLPVEIEKDEKGFIITGSSAANSTQWILSRPPFLLETSRPGVFAAGDVRSMSSKRVASAAGEGSMTVQFVHEYLKSTEQSSKYYKSN